MRERVAIVFMTLSVLATLALGGAVAYALSHRGGPTALEPLTSSVEGQAYTSSGGGQTITGIPNGGQSSAPSGGSSAGSGSGPAVQPSVSPSSGASVGTSSVKPSGGKSGGKPSAKPSGGKKPAATPKQSSSGGTTTQSSGPAVQHGGTITVGGIFDETGPIDATVERDTVRSYFDLVNSQGGVNGYKIQLVDCDSKYDPSAAHQCAQKLISEGVLAIVGWLSLSGEQTETPYLTGQGVPIIGGLGVPAEFSSPLSFPTTPSLVTEGTALGSHAGDVGIKKPGVIFLNANFIAPVESSFLAAMKAKGITPVDVETVDATQPDYTSIVLKFQAEGAQSVVAFLDPFSYSRLFQAMERQAWHPPVLGGGLDKPSANQQYDAGCGSSCAVFGAYSATPVLEPLDHSTVPAVSLYLNTVRKFYPSQANALDVYSAYQWIAAEVFVQAIKNIGNNPVNRQTLVAALDNLKNYSTGGFTNPISYGSGNHDPLHCLQWLQNTNGQWKTTSGWNCF